MLIWATLGTQTEKVPFTGGADISWWQTIGAMVAVFAMLVLFLRLLGRFSRRGGARDATVLTVWHLGPKREIQVLQLGQDVHYIYRHEGAMVLLKQEPLAAFQEHHSAEPHPDNGPAWKRLLPGIFSDSRNQSPASLNHSL